MRWAINKITDIYDVRDGTHDSPKYVNKGHPLITSKNLKNNQVNYDKVKFISNEDYKHINKRSRVDVGDVLFAMIGTIGNPVVINKEPDFAIKNVALFKPKENQNSNFLRYYLESNKTISKMQSEAKGTTQKFVGLGYLRNFLIPTPPLSEQNQIVETLDKAFKKIDKAIANVERNIQNTEELFRSKTNQIFSNSCDDWSETKMVDLCDILTCGVASTPKYVDESIGIPFLSAQNVRNGKVVLHKYRYISKKLHEHLSKKNKPSKGDILYSRVGAKFGEAAVVEHDFEFSVYVSLTLIRPNAEKLYNYYLKYFLNSPSIKSLAKSSITSSGVPNLNVKSVRDFPIRYPNLSEQIRIVASIDGLSEHIQSLMSSYREELKNLEELKKSILEKAFNGELTSAA